MVGGSWLMVQGSCLKARGSRLMAHGQENRFFNSLQFINFSDADLLSFQICFHFQTCYVSKLLFPSLQFISRSNVVFPMSTIMFDGVMGISTRS